MNCVFCEEPIIEQDVTAKEIDVMEPGGYGEDVPVNCIIKKRKAHNACVIRQTLGGVNHQRGLCSCYGGTADPDPEGLTGLEAALAAVEEWDRTHD